MSARTLEKPTSRSFFDIVTFLFRSIDPNLSFAGKPEVEVAQMFKRLRYPFQISRSSLCAIGAPHSWPSLLAALAWLVELLGYMEDAEGPEAARTQEDDGAFFDYVAKSYDCFLKGDDAQCDVLEEELLRSFAEQDEHMAARHEELRRGNHEMLNERDRLQALPSPTEELERRKALQKADAEKFRQLISKLHGHKGHILNTMTERRAELNAKTRELRVVESECAELEAQIELQPVGKEDAERMAQQRAALADTLQRLEGRREAATAEAVEDEAAAARKLGDVEEALLHYHTAADRLELIPSTAKRAEGIRFEAALDKAAGAPGQMINVDLKGRIHPHLEHIRARYAGRLREAGAELAELQGKQRQTDETVGECKATIAALQADCDRMGDRYKESKDAVDAEVSAKETEAREMHDFVLQRRQSADTSLAQSEAQFRAKQAEYEEVRTECLREEEALNAEVAGGLEALIAHKLHIQQTLKKCHEHVLHAQEELQSKALPEL